MQVIKRFLLLCFLNIIIFNTYAQKIETVYEIPVDYWNNRDPYEGSNTDIYGLLAFEDGFILNGYLIRDTSLGFFKVDKSGFSQLPPPFYKGTEGTMVYGYLPYGFAYGYTLCGEYGKKNYLHIQNKNKSWEILETDYEGGIPIFRNSFYLTDNRLFFSNSGQIDGIINLNDDGTYVINSKSQINDYLTQDKLEELGWNIEYFSEVMLSNPSDSYWYRYAEKKFLKNIML